MEISINQWLKGERDYKVGVALYQKNKGNPTYLNLFQTAKNSFTIQKLAEELELLIFPNGKNNNHIPPQILSGKSRTLPTHGKNASEDTTNVRSTLANLDHVPVDSTQISNFPSELQALIELRYKYYREIEYMKNQLPKSDKETRRIYCIRIVTQYQFIDNVWKSQKHFQETGVFLDFTEVSKKSKAKQLEIGQQIRNARSNISKHKKSNNKKQLLKWQAILAKLNVELQSITEDAI